MSIVITNGTYYIKLLNTGKLLKVKNMQEAKRFSSIREANEMINKAKKKCNGYYVLNKKESRTSNKKQKRKQYSYTDRMMIYKQAEIKCSF